MLWNIIDNRKNKYQWRDLNAVLESTAHDNSIQGADKVDDTGCGFYEDRVGISLQEAVRWAEQLDEKVTLFLYSRGDGIE